MKILLMALTTIFLTHAKCISFQSSDVTLTWTAFKTPSKVGVPGQFKDLGLKPSYQGENIKKILKGLSFAIDTNSTDTELKERDQKIVNFFFKKMTKEKITGSISKIKNDELIVNLNMNDHTLDIPMSYKLEGDEFIASGVMDVFDFNLHESLKGINKACEALHLGKTWNDVELELKIKVSKCKS